MKYILLLLLFPFESLAQSKGFTIKNNQLVYVRGTGDTIQISGVAWGAITGTLANQSDLNTALGLKANAAAVSNVDNTSDANKPVSTAQAASIATKSSIYVGLDAGSNDSYVITASPAPGSYTTGMVVIFKANTVNTGAASINVNGLGAKTIVKRVNTVLANGDIPATAFCMLIYDGTNFTLTNPIVN